ncbi:MAG: VCBS repeat-containing protein [SAR324 cluster bacterium]|nr:VCBS repeat-containing protein [SAR324 cluster bacterium]
MPISWNLLEKVAIFLFFLLVSASSSNGQIANEEPPSDSSVLLEDQIQMPDYVYEWERVFYGNLNNERQLLYTQTFARSQMSLADIDGDGDDDLFIGKADGKLAYFENTGRNDEAKFELRTEAFNAIHMESGTDGSVTNVEKEIDVGENASPTFVDIDADDDLDLFVGSKDGNIFYFQNDGNSLLPVFTLKEQSYMSLRPGGNSVPRFLDINTDRTPDLLVGTHLGKVFLYKNAGVPREAMFCGDSQNSLSSSQAPCRYPAQEIGDIAPEVDASPAWVDWNHDGLMDIAVGKASGRIGFYYNKGAPFEPRWELESERFLLIDAGGYASPLFYDLNKDGFPELLVGTSTSNIVYYDNREVLQTGLRKIPDLDVSDVEWQDGHLSILQKMCTEAKLGVEPACLAPLARAFLIPDTVAQDLNSYADFIVKMKKEDPAPAADPAAAAPAPAAGQAPEVAADQTAPASKEEIAADIAQAMANRNNLWMVNRNFLKFGHFLNGDQRAVVTSGDWDQDGDLDLLIGSRSGNLFAYENVGTAQSPNWRQLLQPVFNANQRINSAPTLVDIDGDGDLDILVGNQLGKLELITNTGTAVRPEWKIENLLFADVDVGSDSIPALIDINQDEDLDLFVGNSRGRIIYYENIGSKTNQRFARRSTRFAILSEELNVAPAFFDREEDGDPDLVLGGKDGLLRLVDFNYQKELPVTQGWELKENKWAEIETVGNSVPHFTDWDGDQKMDLMLGDGDGNVLLWLNRGFKKADEIIVEKPLEVSNSIDNISEEGTALAGAEDGPLEPPMEEEKAVLAFNPVYVLIDPQYLPKPEGIALRTPLSVPQSTRKTSLAQNLPKLMDRKKNVMHRLVPAFFDEDGDGDEDLVIGTREGYLFHFLNEGNAGEPRWVQTEERFLGYMAGRNATPVFSDINQDGKVDLLVGNARGTISYWENQGTLDFPEFIPNPTLFQGVLGGVNTRPALLDIDNNGMVDLLIGNFRGQLVLYVQNTDPNQGVQFQLMNRKFLGLKLGIGSAPTVADLNNDGIPELIIGYDHGEIIAYDYQDPGQGIPAAEFNWTRNNTYFNQMEAPPLGSFPTFTDIDHDGDNDLFVGGDDGSFYFYRNDGKPGAPP